MKKELRNYYGDIIAIYDGVNQKLIIYTEKLKGITIVVECEKKEMVE